MGIAVGSHQPGSQPGAHQPRQPRRPLLDRPPSQNRKRPPSRPPRTQPPDGRDETPSQTGPATTGPLTNVLAGQPAGAGGKVQPSARSARQRVSRSGRSG